jgi:hypothetical protein
MTAPHPIYIPRHVVLQADEQHQSTRPIVAFRQQAAYVLLGEPGSGKTRLFEEEAAILGAAARLTTVRDFLRSEPDGEDNHRTLFIDAMDEQRAADGQLHQPLDRLIEKLAKLGRPRFRLSCRAADWHHLDTGQLATISGDGRILELQLQPFTEPEILLFLQDTAAHRPLDPSAFISRARQNGLESMLGNPMLLHLLVQAVSGDAWPASRTEIFHLACRRLAEEHNETHERLAGPVDTDELLDDAGMLCAILLLSDSSTYCTSGQDADSVRVRDLATPLGISAERIARALNTSIFLGAGAKRCYRHRSIAEFLAARAIAKRLDTGLPVTRIIALMSSNAGGIVDALRGLYGWLVSFSSYRDVLIQHDILAVVYYGDVRDFSTDTKRRVFDTIYQAARSLPGLGRRDWQSTAFGALGTPNMESYLKRVLVKECFDDADEVLLLSVLEAIEHGQPMSGLLRAVEVVASDARHWDVVRQAAVDALVAQSDPQNSHMLALLAAIRDGTVQDEDDELAGRLLKRLYPAALGTCTLVQDYLAPPRQDNFFGSYRDFWELQVWSQVPTTDAVLLADAICEMVTKDAASSHRHFLDGLYSRAILNAVSQVGAFLPPQQLYQWICAGLDKYGYRMRPEVQTRELSQWLVGHPVQLQAIYEYGLVQLHAQGKDSYFRSWQQLLLYGVEIPNGWHSWLLDLATRHDEEAIVQHCFGVAAWSAAHTPEKFAGGLEQIDDWIKKHCSRWPAADDWREANTSVPLEEWRYDERAYEIERAKEIAAFQAQRRELFTPELDVILAGGVAPRLMEQVLSAMEHGGYGIEGDTPHARVQAFLGCDTATAQRVIESLATVLDREALPSWSKVIELHANQKRMFIQTVSLYAADQRWGTAENAVGIATYQHAPTLLAFSLVRGQKRAWFNALARAQPEQVGAVMKAFLSHALKHGDHGLSAIRWLNGFPQDSQLPADVLDFLLPQLIPPFDADFPKGSMGAVLHGAIRYARPVALERWVESMLSTHGITENEQTIALTASLAYSDRRFDELLAVLARAPEMAATCCGIFEQSSPRTILGRLSIPLIGKLVEQLGRLVPPRSEPIYSIRKEDDIRSGVTALLAELASRSAPSAMQELARLQAQPALKPWRYRISDYRLQGETRVREATFDHGDPLKVANVLSNREPANERDLIAFVLDHIDTVMCRIRYGNTNMLRMFWRQDKQGKRLPKIENECRDLFLDYLEREMAPMGIHIGKEQPTAGDKRSDMAITMTRRGRHISVPVEVKLDSHPEVWRAWETQLMRLYAPDPDAGGHGVYLVMFTGHKTRRSPTRERPHSAQAMAQAFCALIPATYHGRLYGSVLDISLV